MLVVATNKYIKFVQPLLDSAKQHFMTDHEMTMFVFTDSPSVPEGTVRIEQEHQPWPFSTLKRYHIFTKNEEQLTKMDYLYYSDADMRFVDTVGDEALGDLVATLHPGFYNKPRAEFTYEDRPASSAYMAPNEGYSYFAGGFNGGKTGEYLKMAKWCRDCIDADEKKGIVPRWHDESVWNRYLWLNPPTNVLSPSYCYQEGANLPFKQRLLALNKNHHDMRFGA